MVSLEKKIIFIHIPKCAGTSISQIFGHLDKYGTKWGAQDHRTIRDLCPIPWNINLLNFENRHIFRKRLFNIRSPYNPKNNIKISKSEFNNFFKFTVVRNPWERCFVLYRRLLMTEFIPQSITFKSFLKQNLGQGDLRPMHYWLKDFSGNITFDHIVRFENFRDEMQLVLQKFNMDFKNFPYLLKTEYKKKYTNYKNFYDDESIAMVKEFHKDDISYFNYSYD